MAFTKLTYGKSWVNPADFPTYEASEQKVRDDLQYHPDAIMKYLNEVLLAELEKRSASASIGDERHGTVALTIEDLYKVAAELRNDLEQAILNSVIPSGTALSDEDVRKICV